MVLIVVDDAFTAAECAAIVKGCVFSPTLTNKFGETFTNAAVRTDHGAVIGPRKAKGLLTKVRAALPAAAAINPLIRVSKFAVGAKCAKHRDATYTHPTAGKSKYTVLVYLTTPTGGGATKFTTNSLVVDAVRGRMVIFDQSLRHESLPVTAGTKVAMRTDVVTDAKRVQSTGPRPRGAEDAARRRLRALKNERFRKLGTFD